MERGGGTGGFSLYLEPGSTIARLWVSEPHFLTYMYSTCFSTKGSRMLGILTVSVPPPHVMKNSCHGED